jgi:hypothetical protein
LSVKQSLANLVSAVKGSDVDVSRLHEMHHHPHISTGVWSDVKEAVTSVCADAPPRGESPINPQPHGADAAAAASGPILEGSSSFESRMQHISTRRRSTLASDLWGVGVETRSDAEVEAAHRAVSNPVLETVGATTAAEIAHVPHVPTPLPLDDVGKVFARRSMHAAEVAADAAARTGLARVGGAFTQSFTLEEEGGSTSGRSGEAGVVARHDGIVADAAVTPTAPGANVADAARRDDGGIEAAIEKTLGRTNAVESAGAAIEQAAEKAKGAIQAELQQTKDSVVESAKEKIQDALSGAKKSVQDTAVSAISGTKKAVQGAADAAIESGSNAIRGAARAAMGAALPADGISNTVAQLAASAGVDAAAARARGVTTDVTDRIGDAANAIVGNAAGAEPADTATSTKPAAPQSQPKDGSTLARHRKTTSTGSSGGGGGVEPLFHRTTSTGSAAGGAPLAGPGGASAAAGDGVVRRSRSRGHIQPSTVGAAAVATKEPGSATPPGHHQHHASAASNPTAALMATETVIAAPEPMRKTLRPAGASSTSSIVAANAALIAGGAGLAAAEHDGKTGPLVVVDQSGAAVPEEGAPRRSNSGLRRRS